MLYDAYEVQRSLLSGASRLAGLGAGWLNNPSNPFGYSSMGPMVAAGLEVFAHASAPRGKPEFGIEQVLVGKKPVAVYEDIELRKPFGQLKHFRKIDADAGEPLLIVAPMSGHYATLLRGTVQRMLPKHDVFITDWRDAKLVPTDEGSFDLDDYIDYLVEFCDAVAETNRQASAYAGGLSAVGPSLRCNRDHECRQASGDSQNAHDDGRTDRHAPRADRGQHAGDRAAACLVSA